MSLPHDYMERVYAGVLGKIIGVYLGRPFEGWTYERIMGELGEIRGYVHEQRNVPLIVTDDDISGTFTFLRALPDYANDPNLTPAQIGQTWLNYIIEGRTILWWGGMGNSTEHTAYLRLKHGIEAPRSGSIALNGQIVAEQIGAQIFIDGWAMIAPGDPERAAEWARRAGSVSHDGAAVHGAQVLAAMQSLAFVEPDAEVLLDTAMSLIPSDSIIHYLIGDIREWHAGESDWRKTREWIATKYGYDRYGGNCHMVPNHALIIHALLHGEDDFARSLMIVNTSGWDTDCNSGNLGCLLGIKNGLAGIDSASLDWRGPVADRLYLPTADGGRAISDAATEAIHVVNIGRALAGEEPIAPKGGARFHFALPGSVQGFQAEDEELASVENVLGHSQTGERSLAIRCHKPSEDRTVRVASPTFTPSAETAHYFNRRGYALLASPTLYSGQTLRAAVVADERNHGPVRCNLYLRVYGPNDELVLDRGPEAALAPGERHEFIWTVGDTGGAPIAFVGLEIQGKGTTEGTIYLDYLAWSGTPETTLRRPDHAGEMWRAAWVNGVDQYESRWPEAYRLVQNEGRGLFSQGTREWTDYAVSAEISLHMAKAAGIAARVQGMRRFYALLLCDDGKARLIKALDGDTVLAAADFPWQFGESHTFALIVEGNRIRARIDDQPLFDVEDADRPLAGGGVALVCEEGRIACEAVRVAPAKVEHGTSPSR